MNVLVISLNRFGDLLQSQPVFHALKAQGHNVGLVCLSSFAFAVDLLTDVDYTLALPGGKIFAELDKDWRMSLAVVYEYSSQIQKDFPVDVVINLTASVSARLLARFLGKNECELRGFRLNSYGYGNCTNGWSAYLLSSASSRINCSFNVADMFCKSAKCSNAKITNSLRQPSLEILEEIKNKIEFDFKSNNTTHSLVSESSFNIIEKKQLYNVVDVDNSSNLGELSSELFKTLSNKLPAEFFTNKAFKIEGCNGFIAFQLGASDILRQWPIDYFVQLGHRLWTEFKICPILLGVSKEKNLGQEYAQKANHKFIDFIGATNISQLVCLVSLSRLLVTNDTGTMHLAAGLGIPILAFFLATAQAWDTAPYLENSCCLEPGLDCHPCSFKNKCQNEYACIKAIDPETVITLITQYLKVNKWEYTLNSNNNAQVRIWTTFSDDFGCIDLKCLSQHEFEDRTLWIRIQRHFIRYMLDSLDGYVGQKDKLPWPDKYLVKGISPKLHGDIYNVLCGVENLLFLLMQYVQLVKDKPELKLGGKIISTYNKIKIVFSQMPHFISLKYFWVVTLNEHSEDLDSIFKNTALMKDIFSSWRQYWES